VGDAVEEHEPDDYAARLKTGGRAELAAGVRERSADDPSSLIGREFSGYGLTSHLADGGMSRVFRARRVDGRFDRDVAVKVSITAPLNDALRDRFLQEQQILAGLNHPGIAQLYDAGVSEEGWPYIVMELVEGLPIDRYSADLGVGSKLRLLVDVCEALSFAHRRLIVHRDIKPGNVLVTRDGQAKLLDFGIARQLTESAATTGALALTPRYASPEQLLGQPAAVASDVYQTGLLLAELLSPELLERPTELGDAIQRASSGAEPVLSRRVGATLPDDLIGIVEQCVRSNPAERYGEISDLRDDLQRYLEGFPVRARGNSRRYRARKFARRNRRLLASAATAAVLFVGSGSWYLLAVTEARNRAEIEAATSREVTEFLAGLFKASSPSEAQGQELTAQQLLARGLERLDEQLADRPRVHARLQSVLGSVYLEVGDYATARDLLAQALKAQRRVLGERHPATIETLRRTASAASSQGALTEAEELYRQVIALAESSFAVDREVLLNARRQLASVLRQQGDFAAAADIQRTIVEDFEAAGRLASLDGIRALTGLAIATMQGGDPPSAIPYFERSLTLSRDTLGSRHPQTLGAINNMGITFQELGRPEEALPYVREAHELSVEVHGADHHRTIFFAINHSNSLRELDRLDEARRLAEPALEAALATLPKTHPATDVAYTGLGQLELAAGNYARAEALLGELLDIERQHLGPQHMYTIGTQLKLASAVEGQGRIDEAAVIVEEAVALMHGTQGPDHQETLLAEKHLAALRAAQGRAEEARNLLLELLPPLSEQLGEQAQQVREVRALLARL